MEGLKNEVKALKARCDMLKKTVRVLQTICNIHQRALETWQQHIVTSQHKLGILDLSYNGEEYKLM